MIQEQFRERSKTQGTTPSRRPHSPDGDAPFKTPRRSEAHLTPGQYSIQSEHSPLAMAIAEDTVMGNTTPPARSPFNLPPTQPASPPLEILLSQIKTTIATETKARLEQQFEQEKRQIRAELEQQFNQEKRQIRAELEQQFDQERSQYEKDKKSDAAMNESIRETSLRALNSREEDKKLIADLKSENAKLAAQLESEKVAKAKMEGKLDAMTTKNRMHARTVNENETQLSFKSSQHSILGGSEMGPTPEYRFLTSNNPGLGSEFDHNVVYNDTPWSMPAQESMPRELMAFRDSGIPTDFPNQAISDWGCSKSTSRGSASQQLLDLDNSDSIQLLQVFFNIDR